MLINPFPQYNDYIQEVALKRYPEECVLLITEKSGCYEVNNISLDPCNSFSISKQDTNRAFDEGLLAVIHSHPDVEPVPSSADMTYQRQCNVPFGIIGVSEDSTTDIVYFGDQIKYDLEQRPFIHGMSDCYGLIRDFYREKLDIQLPQYDRSWEWWHDGSNLYLENLKNAGFIEVDEPEYGDMFLASIRSDKPNHGGVYLGNEMIFHHLTGKDAIDMTRLPETKAIHRYTKYITGFYRHESRL